MPLFDRSRDGTAPAPPAAERPRPGVTPAGGAPVRRTLAAHREHLLGQVQSLRPFGIGLLEAAGLTLCESIVADLDLPTFTAATTDGWAVRTSNLVGASALRPVILPVVDRIEAGGYRGAPLTAATAVRVAAGAPVPDGADAVMALDDGLAVGDEVQFTVEARFHQNLVPAGCRVAEGDQLVASGTTLTPRTLAMIAEVGHDKVLARPRPRVVVLTADDTVKPPGLPLTRLGETYDATTTLLAATIRADGAQVFAAKVPATPRAIAVALDEQLVRADLVLLLTEATDDVASMLATLGTADAADVDGLPGRQLFCLIGEERAPLLVLPPAAVPAYLGYLMLGRQLVHRLAGLEPAAPEASVAAVTQEVAADPDQVRLLLCRLTERGLTPVAGDGPGAAELAQADAVIVVPAGDRPIAAHGDANYWLLD